MKEQNNKIELNELIVEGIEYLFSNKAGWTQFTTHFKEKQGIGSSKANKLWNDCWKEINKQTDLKISYDVESAWLEAENLKNIALEVNDRKTYLEALKYQGRLRGLDVQKVEANVNLQSVKLSWGNNETKDGE
jgi:hypothetical protein